MVDSAPSSLNQNKSISSSPVSPSSISSSAAAISSSSSAPKSMSTKQQQAAKSSRKRTLEEANANEENISSSSSSLKQSSSSASPPSSSSSSSSASSSASSPSSSSSSPSSSSSSDELPEVNFQFCPFDLNNTEMTHNLILTLRNRVTNKPMPFIKCTKCKKWRALPNLLSQLSPNLPNQVLTLSAFNNLPANIIPFPFVCANATWDLDRKFCGATQDYTDLFHDFCQIPISFIKTLARFDFYIALSHFLRVKGIEVKEYPCIYSKPVDLFTLYSVVHQLGGDQFLTEHNKWPQVYKLLKLTDTATKPADVDYLVEIYRSYFFEWQNEDKD